MMSDIPEIIITPTAGSKVHRMFSQWQMDDIVRQAWNGSIGPIYKKAGYDEFHILKDGYAVVVRWDDNKLIVPTQMHQHTDYSSDSIYSYVHNIKDEIKGA